MKTHKVIKMNDTLTTIDAKIKDLMNAQDEMMTDDVTVAVLQGRDQIDSFNFEAYEKLRTDVETLMQTKRLLS